MFYFYVCGWEQVSYPEWRAVLRSSLWQQQQLSEARPPGMCFLSAGLQQLAEMSCLRRGLASSSHLLLIQNAPSPTHKQPPALQWHFAPDSLSNKFQIQHHLALIGKRASLCVFPSCSISWSSFICFLSSSSPFKLSPSFLCPFIMISRQKPGLGAAEKRKHNPVIEASAAFMLACLLSRKDCGLYWNRLAQGCMSCIIITKTVLICLAEKAPALILDLYLHSSFFPPVLLAHTHTDITVEKGQWSVWTLVWGLVVELLGSQQLPDGQWRPWEFRKNPSKCSSASGRVMNCSAV